MIYTLPGEINKTDLRWLGAATGNRDTRIVCSSETQRRQIVRRGVPFEQSLLVHPGVDFARIKSRRNSELRQALGLEENDYVLLAPGESTDASNHKLALWTCAILSELDPHCKLLLWSRGPKADMLRAGRKSWRRPNLATFAEPALNRTIEFEELFAAADASLVTANEGAATLPIALCMAAGLPIISVTNRTTSEFLEDRHTAAMVPFPRPRDLARRVLDVRQDAGLQWSISDTARAECYEHFSVSRFLTDCRALYSPAR